MRVPAELSVLLGALALDLLVGEPPAKLHPVVWMGKLQAALRRRAPARPAPAFVYGALMAIAGPVVFGGGAWFVLEHVHGLPGWLLAVYLLKSAFAVRELGAAAQRVRRCLDRKDAPGARVAVGNLVSRDTTNLTAAGIAAAAIESVAENCSDSIVAPLAFYMVGGVPAALAYRAVNTLDAMIGYRGQLEWLGKAAARLDDLANLVPARLTALLVAMAAPLGRGSVKRAIATWARDRALTDSPNAGHPMAAMAGALAVELEKVGAYRLGRGFPAPAGRDIGRAVLVMAGAAALALVLALAIGLIGSGLGA
jgi:adenosylcobinamide-phosphate synthase